MAVTTTFNFTTLNGSDPAGHNSINALINSIDTRLQALSTGLATASTSPGTLSTGQVLRWDGTSYAGAFVDATSLASNAVTTDKINALAVTTAKINDGAVTSAKILDGTIAIGDLAFDPATQAELDTAVSNASTALSNHEADTTSIHGIADTSALALKSGNTYAGTHDYTGAAIIVPTATAGDNDTSAASTAFVTTAISNAALGSVQIATSGIADDAVTADKLRDSASVDADRAVTTNHIRDLAVTNAKLAGSIAYSKLTLTGAIQLSDLAFTLETNWGTPVSYSATATLTPSTDQGKKFIQYTGGSIGTLTIPNSAVYAVGCEINIMQTGTAQVTIQAGTNVSINGTPATTQGTGSSGTGTFKLRTQYSSATLIKRTTSTVDTWFIIGDLAV